MATVRELMTKIGFKTDTKSINKFEDNVKSAKIAIAALTAVIGAASTAMFAFVESAAKTGDRLDKLRDTIGFTTDDYQLLEGAANLAGIENADFAKSLQLFTRSIGMARQGMTQYIKEFAILGVNMRGANGQIKDQKELLFEVADALQHGLVKTVDRAAVAQLLFGRSGLKMINFLEDGREGIKAAMAEFKKYVFVLDKGAIKKSKEFTDRQFLLTAAIKGFKDQIGVGLMPIFKKIINRTLEWLRVNRKLLAGGLIDFFKGVIVVAKVIVSVFKFAINVVKGAVKVWKDLNRAFGMTVKILTGLLALKLLSKLKMFRKLISGGFGLIKFIFSPIGMITAAIVSLLLVLDDVAVFLTGGKSLIGIVIKKFPMVGKILRGAFHVIKHLIEITIILPFKIVLKIIKEVISLFKKVVREAPSIAGDFIKGLGATGLLPHGVTIESLYRSTLTPPKAIGAATTGGNFNFNTAVNLTVPPGTPEMQQDFLIKAAEKSFEPVYKRKLREALTVFPELEQ